jgi:16S rRNA A1518/A1519 N6-dimethyltransferase RsmA/KsgA/DIM1 with predicted DNA glycosylase/AP lyase activity
MDYLSENHWVSIFSKMNLSQTDCCSMNLIHLQLVEVGPGAGALTNLLPIKGIDFKAVELDDEKVVYLNLNYPAIQEKLLIRILQIDAPNCFYRSR